MGEPHDHPLPIRGPAPRADRAAHDSRDRPGALPVSESFVSLQGEGALTGVPSWFVRLGGCNLRCVWCDTPYASWTPEYQNRAIDELIDEARASGTGFAVVTGGEPMIFPRIDSLCARLRELGMHVTIETAGTVFRELACDLMSVSPKLSNSAPNGDPRDPRGVWTARHEARRLDPEALQRLIDRYPARQLKFVVTTRADLDEIDDLLARLSGWRAPEIMLMPEGVVTPEPRRVRWIIEACRRRGWRYCHRLHIELFGDTRGT